MAVLWMVCGFAADHIPQRPPQCIFYLCLLYERSEPNRPKMQTSLCYKCGNRNQHTLHDYYMKYIHANQLVHHIVKAVTIIPKGLQVTHVQLHDRIKQVIGCRNIISMILVHEVSKAGVHHYHGFFLLDKVTKFRNLTGLTVLHQKVKYYTKWVQYITKDYANSLYIVPVLFYVKGSKNNIL